jgi:hypothetical protein
MILFIKKKQTNNYPNILFHYYNTLPENFNECARSGTTSASGITISVIYIVIKIFELFGKTVIL